MTDKELEQAEWVIGYLSEGQASLTSEEVLLLLKLVDYAKSQSEQVLELERNLDHGAMVAVRTAEKLVIERQKDKRYREALEHIANIDGYFQDIPFDSEKALELIDNEARKALEESI